VATIAYSGARRLLRRTSFAREGGQALIMVVLFLAVLLGMAAMVLDVGYAYYTHRSLQASADAAALAGAQELPDPARAQTIAHDYGSSTGGKNQRDNVANVTTSVSTKCIQSVPGCDPVNAITVEERAVVDTMFAKVLGVDHFTVRAKATACSPCGVKPLDVMLVLDRTGSMCQTHSGANDPACTDLNNARDGMRTFLGFMDAQTQWVGLGVLPPATSIGNRCSTPDTPNYNSTSAKYTIVPLSSDYSVNGALKSSSNLVSTINCQKGGGRTAYANALEEAQKELNLHGRTDVQDIIVFLSDGAANIGPTFYSSSSPYRKQPCHQGVWSAAPIKSKGTIIYSIGYDLDALNGGANRCETWDGRNESPAITAYQALEGIASGPAQFYNKPSAGQLRTIFTAIAADMSRGSAALIDESVQ
jgi:Putative Flp pilus-assembly TadE/G-like/von Willebrand factor type A domain